MRNNILKFDRPVPRYTSYPTAPQFKAIEDSGIYKAWLGALGEKSNLSLYIHVPFCQKLCWYCGCNTKITQRYAPIEDYVHLMLREIDMLGDTLDPSHQVKNIHFGGGSPGLLRGCDFDLVMNRLRDVFAFSPDVEIAIELDPRGVTEGRVKSYAKQGVTRVSLGVQDFDDTVLSHVNRQQPFELSQDAVRLLRRYGIAAINFDLIYGLPYQNTDIMAQTIDKALTLDPDRISLFGYAHVPWIKKHMRLINENALPKSDLRFDLFQTGSKKLQDAGYTAIGIDHFAKPDDPLSIAASNNMLRRNFQGYTTEASDALIGIGASSISKLLQGYIQNAVDLPHYKSSILSNILPAQKICPMQGTDHIHAHVIERIMCDFTINLNAVVQQYGLPDDYFAPYIDTLAVYQAEGFVEIDADQCITIKPAARPVTRLIAAAFDAYYSGQFATPKHAKAI